MPFLVFCNTCKNFSKECIKRDGESNFVTEDDSCKNSRKIGKKEKGYFKLSCKDYEIKD